MFSVGRLAAVTLLASAPAFAQFPAVPAGVKVLESRFGEGIKITYKQVLDDADSVSDSVYLTETHVEQPLRDNARRQVLFGSCVSSSRHC